MVNKSGPRTEPWGTPTRQDVGLEEWEPNRTTWDLPVRYSCTGTVMQCLLSVCLSCLSVCLTVRLSVKKKKISHRHLRHYIGPLRGSTFSTLSRWGLNPIKPVYDPDQPDDRLNLIASAFNQLGQYTNSPGRRGYCYAELAVFFPSGGRNHRQYSLRLPTEGWPGMLSWPGWLVT